MMLVDYEDVGNMSPVSPADKIKVTQGASLIYIKTDTANFRDDTVIIAPSEDNNNNYSVEFDMSKNTVEAVQSEVKDVRKKSKAVTFSNFVENAVLYYLVSEQWIKVKKGFIDSGDDW